jgi:hypothetical protein
MNPGNAVPGDGRLDSFDNMQIPGHGRFVTITGQDWLLEMPAM